MLFAVLLYGKYSTIAETHRTKTASKETQKSMHATCQGHSKSHSLSCKTNQTKCNSTIHNEQLDKM